MRQTRSENISVQESCLPDQNNNRSTSKVVKNQKHFGYRHLAYRIGLAGSHAAKVVFGKSTAVGLIFVFMHRDKVA